MTNPISKTSNSRGLTSDATLPELTHLKAGDQVNMAAPEGDSVAVAILHPMIEADQAATTAKRLISKNSELFLRLSK